jgi:sugar phosphate isomerase/epimerase
VPVELGLTADPRWEIETSGLVNVAREAGFSTLGIGADRVDADAARAFQSAGVGCHELVALVVSDDETTMLTSAERLASAASVVGARWIITAFLGSNYGVGTAKLIRRCADMFNEVGAGMAVEFLSYGPVTSISQGLEVVDVVGIDRAAVLIDSWHFFFGGSTWEELQEVPLERIAYVHFDDALPPLSDDLLGETGHRRAVPGDGIIELDRFASTLLERGWHGLVSAEVLSRELRALPMLEIARRIHEASARYWS